MTQTETAKTDLLFPDEWGDAIAAARAEGHIFVDEDPANPISGRWRVTCANPKCDQSILRPRNYIYGGATEQPCKPWPEHLTPKDRS
jgi:hypothetical protein